MSESLFPSIPGTDTTSTPARQSLPLYRDVKWDFEKRAPVFVNGNPVIVEGSEAVHVWAWHAIQAERYHYEHESFDYGCELYRLRGKSYQKGTVEAEARRYITEALLANPYITSAEVTELELVEDVLKFSVRYADIYGGGGTVNV